MSPQEELGALLEAIGNTNQRLDGFIDTLPEKLQRWADEIYKKFDARLQMQKALCSKEIEAVEKKVDTFEEWALKYAADEGKKAGEDLPDLPGEERVKAIKRYLKIGSLPILIISSCIGLGILFSSILVPEIFISTFSSIIPQ